MREQIPGAVLCDLDVNETFFLVRELRALERQDGEREIEVVALTDSSSADDRAQLYAGGVTNALTKPIGQEELVASLTQLFGAGAGV
jgi:CheY-like chemotaxis protein